MKASEFFKTLTILEAKAETQAQQADQMTAFFRAKIQVARELRDAVDEKGLTADAEAELLRLNNDIAEGPTGLDPLALPAEEPQPIRTRRDREPCQGRVNGVVCGRKRGHIPGCSVIAASKAPSLPEPVCPVCLDIAPGTPAKGNHPGPFDDEPCAHCNPAGKTPAELKVYDVARCELAGKIRRLQDTGKALIPSDASAELGVTIEEVRAAWPLLAGEKAL